MPFRSGSYGNSLRAKPEAVVPTMYSQDCVLFTRLRRRSGRHRDPAARRQLPANPIVASQAFLTRLSLKAVDNAIDKNVAPVVVRPGTSDLSRLLNPIALLVLTLEDRLASRLFPEMHRRLFARDPEIEL